MQKSVNVEVSPKKFVNSMRYKNKNNKKNLYAL